MRIAPNLHEPIHETLRQLRLRILKVNVKTISGLRLLVNTRSNVSEGIASDLNLDGANLYDYL